MYYKGIFDELRYLHEFLKINENKIVKDYRETKSAFKEFKEVYENYFADVWSALETQNKNLKKEISTLKSRITRQTNEQNNERKAFLKLIEKSEKDFLKVLK